MHIRGIVRERQQNVARGCQTFWASGFLKFSRSGRRNPVNSWLSPPPPPLTPRNLLRHSSHGDCGLTLWSTSRDFKVAENKFLLFIFRKKKKPVYESPSESRIDVAQCQCPESVIFRHPFASTLGHLYVSYGFLIKFQKINKSKTFTKFKTLIVVTNCLCISAL